MQPCSPHGTVSVERRQAAGVRAMHPCMPAVKGRGAHMQPCSPHGTVSVDRRQAAGVRAMHPCMPAMT